MIEGYDRERDISLYIHVPFCRSRCDYCAFYSSVFDRGTADAFYDVLEKELVLLTDEIAKPYQTIYFGGGNPLLLGYDRILSLIDKASRYGVSREVTVEVNPEDIDRDLSVLYPHVTRISTGIQTMSDPVLSFLKRRSREKDNCRALEILSSSPFTWNADIMTALPGTEIGDTVRDIDRVASFGAGHISFYCLTFEENTPLIRKAVPYGEEKERAFLLAGWNELEKLGYRHYEISAFEKGGHECLHNSRYWSLMQYIGLGPSAESFLGYAEGVSMRNTEDMESFIRTHAFNCERLSSGETQESYLLTALRTEKGIDKIEYERRFGLSFDTLYGERIRLIDEKLYADTPFSFSLTEEGMLLLDSVILTLSLAI